MPEMLDTLFPLESIPPQKHPFRCDCVQCQEEIKKRMIPCPNCGATGVYDDCTCSYCNGAKLVYDVNYIEEVNPLPKKATKPSKPTPPPLARRYKILANGLRGIANNSNTGLSRQLVLLTVKDQIVDRDELLVIAKKLKELYRTTAPSEIIIRRAVDLGYLEEVKE